MAALVEEILSTTVAGFAPGSSRKPRESVFYSDPRSSAVAPFRGPPGAS
jgi:hypothetical protein